MVDKIYIKDGNKYEIYEKIYHSILAEALAGSEDNCRIDNNCFKALCEAFSTEELMDFGILKSFKKEDIDFVIDAIFQDKEIYYDDGNLGVN